MALKLEMKEYEAIDSLSGHPAWVHLLDWMKAGLAQERKDTDKQLNDVLLRQAQGRCQVLDMIVEAAEKAPALTREYRQRQRRP